MTRWNEQPDRSTDAHPWRDLVATEMDNVVRVTWTGPSAAAFYTSDGPSLFFEQPSGNGWRPVAWDNIPEVEVDGGPMGC